MIALRPPSDVMRLECLGASHQTRLSFMRVLLRQMAAEGWRADRPRWQIGADGTGHAVYRVRGSGQTYSLLAFAHNLPAEQRSDRVIAEAWDATFALLDGEVTDEDVARLAKNVPLQEAGRITDKELVLSRANKSVRIWDYVVGALARGVQPDAERVAEIGYLMRTTAVYGSGKFGAADFQKLRGRPVVGRGAFRVEMLAVWLIRAFVFDLVEHMARLTGGEAAAPLAPALRRRFGIGNATGLGMAPFLVNHPTLLNAWILARETALGRVRALDRATPETRHGFLSALADARAQMPKASDTDLAQDLARIAEHVAGAKLDQPNPWDRLWHWAAGHLSLEGREFLVSLMIEPHGEIVDDLADTMSVDETAGFRIDGRQRTARLKAHLATSYGWALDYPDTEAGSARFWYTSAEKLEPRLGARFEEPGAARELPLATARDISALAHDLAVSGAQTVAAFLLDHPQHRHSVRRVQQNMTAPYSEVQGNLIGQEMRPIDLLRCKLAFFGATRFDPRSDRWLRITMFQNAPLPEDLCKPVSADAWVYAGEVA